IAGYCFFQAEDGIRDFHVTGVQTCALPIFPQTVYGVQLLTAAMAKAKSTDPVKVAAALEGLSVNAGVGGEITMRKSDHQLQQHRSEERRVGKDERARWAPGR